MFKLYFKYAAMHLSSQLEYKFPFLVHSLSNFLAAFTSILTLGFVLDRFGAIGDFSLEHCLLGSGVTMFSFYIARCFFGGFDRFAGLVKSGSLDMLLIRPLGIIYQVVVQTIRFDQLAGTLSGLLVLIYAIDRMGLWGDPVKLLVIAYMVVGGTAFFAGVFILYSGLCFFTLEGLEFINVFTHGLTNLARYPIGVYGKAILGFFTFVLPFAGAQHYPLLYITGANTNPVLAFAPTVCILFLAPCIAFWRLGLSRYQSTGS